MATEETVVSGAQGDKGAGMMKIDKLVLWILIGLACPILLPVIAEEEEQ